MGEVYRAHDARLGRDVAIKIISDRGARDPRSLGRFEQEAKAVASVSHPNILAIHDFGTDNGVSFAVMELLRGESLEDRLAREGLSRRDALQIAAAVADGLAAAHSRGIIHRDLKPANIFLTDDGLVKILDFGLAKRFDSDALSQVNTQTRPGLIAGTAGYMSPEQVTAAPVDARSDIFALGCILYEMISGKPAFRKASTGESLAAVLRDAAPDLGDTPIASIVRRCLQKSPDDRFQSARDLSFALKGILGSSDSVRPVSHRPRIAYGVAAVVAAVVIAASSIIIVRSRTARIHTLAVLPLSNPSGDAGQDYFADGMTEQLISGLARLNGLRVTSQTSSMSFKHTKKTLPQIAHELGVDRIVEGSVVREGNRMRITAELIDAKSDQHLWSDTYERDVRDVFSLQRDVATAIARQVRFELTDELHNRLTKERTIDPRSFDAFIRARYSFNKGGRDDLFRAVEQFRQALDFDPTNSRAYAGLADTYSLIGYWSYISPGDSFPKAKAAAQHSLEIDPSSAEAHAALGYIHMYYDWAFADAQTEFKTAIGLNPNLASAHRYYAIYLGAMLRPVEARSEAAIARTLDPLSVPIATDSGFVMYYERDYVQAEKTLRDAIGINPKAPGPHFWLARVYQAQQRYNEAAAEYNLAGPGISKIPPIYAGLGHMYAVTGKRAEAEQVLRAIEETSKGSYLSPYAPALVYLGLGEREKAIDLLNRCLQERTSWMVWLLKDPRWDPMRSDPRFQQIVRKVGFPADAQARQPHA